MSNGLKPNRTPWIIAGVLGCLVVCLLFAAVIVVGGFVMFNYQPTPVVQNVGTPIRVPSGSPTATLVSAQATQMVQATSAPAATNTPAPSGTTAPSATSTVPRPSSTIAATTAPSTSTPRPTFTSTPSDIIRVPTRTPTESFDLVTGPTRVPPTATTRPTTAPPSPTTQPTASPDNFLIAFSKDEGPNAESKKLWLMYSDGSEASELTNLASHPILNRAGNQMVFYHWTDGLFILNWVDMKNITLKRLVGDTFTGGDYGSGDWSHDGRWVAFSKQPGGKGNIVVDLIAPDGTQQHTVQIGESPSWSPDDTQLVFHTCRGSNCGIFKGSSNGTGQPEDAIPVVTDDGGLPAWSPDGKWIVYQKDVDGQKQLFLIAPDGSGKKQLTNGPAMHVDAGWSPDGSYIFYRSPEGGSWGIWRMNISGGNRVKVIDNVAPVNWPYERLSISR